MYVPYSTSPAMSFVLDFIVFLLSAFGLTADLFRFKGKRTDLFKRLSGPLASSCYYFTIISKAALMLAFASVEYMFFGIGSYIAGLISPYPIVVSFSGGIRPSSVM